MTDATPGTGALAEPTLLDVFRARRTIRPYLQPTPLNHYPALARALGCEAWLKCEHMLPTGAFKVRGGFNLVAHLTPEERARGVITASTGNHGQSIALAARTFGVRAIVAAPVGVNPYKLQAMRDLGAEVVEVGRDFDEARLWVETEARERGYRYIHSADEPLLIAGVATGSLEIVEALPDVEAIVVPIGGGSGACGACIVAKSVNPRIQVIGVQAEGAPAAYRAWRERRLVELPELQTFAEGIATRVAFALPQRILARLIDDIVLVSDDELRAAIRLLLATAHQLAEGAGAASTAAALKLRDRLAGRRVALVVSGGNLAYETLEEIIQHV